MPDDLLDSLDVAERSAVWHDILDDKTWPCYVAIEQGKVIGFIHVCACRDRDNDPGCTGEISAMYVDPDHWHRGHGTALLRRGLDELTHRGMPDVTLWVLERNISARSFYQVHGFNADGMRKSHARSGLTEVRYARHCSMSNRA